jgi:hypothetical protein
VNLGRKRQDTSIFNLGCAALGGGHTSLTDSHIALRHEVSPLISAQIHEQEVFVVGFVIVMSTATARTFSKSRRHRIQLEAGALTSGFVHADDSSDVELLPQPHCALRPV